MKVDNGANPSLYYMAGPIWWTAMRLGVCTLSGGALTLHAHHDNRSIRSRSSVMYNPWTGLPGTTILTCSILQKFQKFQKFICPQ